jgi:hypothetical protein
MKRLCLILIMTVVIGGTAITARAAPPSPGCAVFPHSGIILSAFTGTGPFAVGETITINVFDTTTFALRVNGTIVIPSSPTPGTFSHTFVINAANFQINAGMNFNGSITCTPSSGPGGSGGGGTYVFNGITRALDDRLDRRWGVPVASYCRFDGFHFYLIGDDSKGLLKLVVTPEEIEAVPEKPEVNTLIAESPEHIRVYRLTTGEFQVNYGLSPNGDEYAWSWITCVPDEGTDHSYNIYH